MRILRFGGTNLEPVKKNEIVYCFTKKNVVSLIQKSRFSVPSLPPQLKSSILEIDKKQGSSLRGLYGC